MLPIRGALKCSHAQAIKQQAQLGVSEGLGKLYSNLAACLLQQEQFTKAIQACQQALKVQPTPQESHVALRLQCVFSPQRGIADSLFDGECTMYAVLALCWPYRAES